MITIIIMIIMMMKKKKMASWLLEMNLVMKLNFLIGCTKYFLSHVKSQPYLMVSNWRRHTHSRFGTISNRDTNHVALFSLNSVFSLSN